MRTHSLNHGTTILTSRAKDSRRAVFHIGNNTYSAKLVDLPCVVESQKTLDNKQMVDAVATVGTYNLVARFVEALDIDSKADVPVPIPQ